MTQEQADLIRDLLKGRKNIIIAGSMGTGKTTLLNALINEIAEICPNDRLYIIEDTPEISCLALDNIMLNIKAEEADQAVRSALRSSVDRIIFGELRKGNVAHELLLAWNTGTPGGIATLHSNSAKETYDRIFDLVSQAIPGKLRDTFVTERIQAVIYLEREHGEYPKVKDIHRSK
jgi:Flp pilus assembly CpaF family ATPase